MNHHLFRVRCDHADGDVTRAWCVSEIAPEGYMTYRKSHAKEHEFVLLFSSVIPKRLHDFLLRLNPKLTWMNR